MEGGGAKRYGTFSAGEEREKGLKEAGEGGPRGGGG